MKDKTHKKNRCHRDKQILNINDFKSVNTMFQRSGHCTTKKNEKMVLKSFDRYIIQISLCEFPPNHKSPSIFAQANIEG